MSDDTTHTTVHQSALFLFLHPFLLLSPFLFLSPFALSEALVVLVVPVVPVEPVVVVVVVGKTVIVVVVAPVVPVLVEVAVVVVGNVALAPIDLFLEANTLFLCLVVGPVVIVAIVLEVAK